MGWCLQKFVYFTLKLQSVDEEQKLGIKNANIKW